MAYANQTTRGSKAENAGITADPVPQARNGVSPSVETGKNGRNGNGHASVADPDLLEAPSSTRRVSAGKRLLDLTVLIAAHVALLPLWLLLWTAIPALIWLNDRGPVFYQQQRIGKGGRTFIVRKFRTMVPDADRIGPSWNGANDPRVTRVGRLLRRTALDELPQLLNIWKGEMSFVGPKPLAVEEHAYLCERIPGFAMRTAAVPGLTGLSQLYNREDDAERKLALDMEYIERRSLWLDIKIIVLSVFNTLAARWDGRQGKAAQAVAEE